MKGFAGVAVAALCAASMVEAGCYPKDGYRPPKLTFEEKLDLAVNYEPVDAANHHAHFPRHFDWEDVDGINYLAPSWNQHIPEYCGSCWLHGTLSSVQDRIKIMAKAKGPDVMLARQTLLQCGILANMSNGCHGGEPRNVFDYMHKFGLPDETCMLYRANDTAFMHLKKENKLCPIEGICVNCMHGHTPECWAIEKPLLYSVKSYGPVEPNERAIMAEVFHRGPVVCSMASTDHFDYQYHGGVYVDPNNSTDVNHDVEIVGWGEDEDGTPYWRVRNSWGTYWGEKGFFRIRRGTNELMIENDCWYSIPDITMQRDLDSGKLVGDMVKGLIKNPKWEEMEKKIKEWEKKMEEEKKKEEEEMKKRVEEAKKMEEERKKEMEKMREEMKKKMEEREKALEKIREEIEHIREEQEEEYRERMRERIQRLREEAERRRQHMQQMFAEETIAQRMQHVEDSQEEPAVRLASHL